MTERITAPAWEFDRAFLREMLGSGTNSDRLDVISKALHEIIAADLTERQRQLLILRYMRGMSLPEISDMLGISVSSASRTLQRARERIRRQMRFYFDYMYLCQN